MYLVNIIELRDDLRNGWKPYEWFSQHLQSPVNHCEGLSRTLSGQGLKRSRGEYLG